VLLQSNEWMGKSSFHGKSLHTLSDVMNPYQLVIAIIARTLAAFDDDNLIPWCGCEQENASLLFTLFPSICQ
jgi:E3 ubiquitin-protein ligase RGLG